MPMQKYFIFLLLGGFLVAGVAFADHGEETGVDLVDPAEVVTPGDLGVEDPGVLPTSRLYFCSRSLSRRKKNRRSRNHF